MHSLSFFFPLLLFTTALGPLTVHKRHRQEAGEKALEVENLNVPGTLSWAIYYWFSLVQIEVVLVPKHIAGQVALPEVNFVKEHNEHEPPMSVLSALKKPLTSFRQLS